MHAISTTAAKLFLAGLSLFLTLQLAAADATVPKADIKGAADNHLAKRYEGSFIVSYQKLAFTDFSVPLSPLKPSADTDAHDAMNNRVFAPEKKTEAEGALTRIAYVLPTERSPLEVLRNYQDVIQAAGGEVLFECKKEECGGAADRSSSGGGGDMSLTMYFFHESDLKDAAFSNGACALASGINDQRFFSARVPQDGGDAYVTVQTYSLTDDLYCKALNGRTVAVVQVLEPKARDKKMVVVEAAKMADSLTAIGSISLYGIFFDTDKAEIKPESEPTLKEISTLLANEPKMAVIVVGHTDNQGAFDYNRDLSSRRAQAVKAALVSKYGIDAARLTSAGAGMMAPVASNDDETGRAKNRRVVLVKLN
ncbi:OmpA family protein [Mesorhizobium sp. INR15]|uniref:OmpA family protein n=1 Tax=Mesorhizobium sp. INR15 TaxID=2654248 RepID=UPI00189643C0|nr:OmpA family protein [Mesorhizobium sp. INR15]QPC90897.1 OmpA family protein [Mesorhizobium sp. INR15]